jgi:6-phosphogluconolactonase (cycloisomerase 2 family)
MEVCMKSGLCVAVAALAGGAAVAVAQSVGPAAFVSNNGNLRGSVTSYRVNQDGTLTLVQDLVTGERDSGEPYINGTNAYSISITPNGKYIAVTHATGLTNEQVTVIQVNADATLTPYTTFPVPDSPLDLQWLSNDAIAVTETRSSGTNYVRVYRFNEAAGTFTHFDHETVPGFCSSLALSADGNWLVANQSPLGGSATVHAYRVNADQSLTHASSASYSGYALGLCFGPNDGSVYACAGSLGNWITGYGFDNQTGQLSYLAGTPYSVPGSSPKQAVLSPSGTKLLVGYGSDGTVRSFTVDPETADIVSTGQLFDVGIQGSLGAIATLRVNGVELALFTDRETYDGTGRGLCSFVIEADGSLTQKSLRVDGGGIAPSDVVAWAGIPSACGTGDFDGDGDTGTDADIEAFFACLAGNCCATCWSGGADFDGDGDTATDADIEAFFRVLAGGNC